MLASKPSLQFSVVGAGLTASTQESSETLCFAESSGGSWPEPRAAPGIEPGTSRTLSENHATRPSSLLISTGAQTLNDMSMGRTAAAGRCPEQGLLRELNPGPLAPEARIMPLDQAANRGCPRPTVIDQLSKSNRELRATSCVTAAPDVLIYGTV